MSPAANVADAVVFIGVVRFWLVAVGGGLKTAHVTVCSCETISSPQQRSVPKSLLYWSDRRSVQTPLSGFPRNADNAVAGRNEPANGTDPELMGVAASSSNTVAPRRRRKPLSPCWDRCCRHGR